MYEDGKVKVVMDNIMEFLKEQDDMIKSLMERFIGMFVEKAHHRLIMRFIKYLLYLKMKKKLKMQRNSDRN